MTITQQRQAARGKAFNSILKMYHPKSTYKTSEFPRDESPREKRDEDVEWIIRQYLKELKIINKK